MTIRPALRRGPHLIGRRRVTARARRRSAYASRPSGAFPLRGPAARPAVRCPSVMMVDHTFVYTGAVRRIHEIVTGETIGRILFYSSERTSLHRFHPETGVLGDLAVHDLAIIDHLIPDAPDSVSAMLFAR